MRQLKEGDHIEHFGVKGMRWGVRRSQRQLQRAANKDGRTRYGKPPSALSNEQLKARIARMETEKRYNDLNARTVSTGERLATEIITSVGRSTVTAAGTGLALYGVSKLVERQMGKEAASWIPKKKK